MKRSSSHTTQSFSIKNMSALIVATIGVVYGDIGTSPLYTMREIFSAHASLPLTFYNVLGALSVIFWSLMIVVSFKYVMLIMRIDNHGEGGTMALLALALRKIPKFEVNKRKLLVAIALFGTSLFFGDGVITPAISVLSAIEGLKIATPLFEPFVVPLSILILFFLFLFQRKGTKNVGSLFGPIMLFWFFTIGCAGFVSIIKTPDVLYALNPYYAVQFLWHHGLFSFVILGAVVLALTGAEVLYSDMGHFGKKPIRIAWFSLILPALTFNYFGQGALLLRDASALTNPFYLLFPHEILYPIVMLATLATIIASQAVISGVFSMARQAIQLGFCPRMEIIHTSEQEIGQVYIPAINNMLLILVVVVILMFGSSSALAAAYGIAVTGAMIITSLLAFEILMTIAHRHKWLTVLPISFFLCIDLAFFSSNMLKIYDGGWFPIALGFIMFTILTTWKRGREILMDRLTETAISQQDFIQDIAKHPPTRVSGTAIFLTANSNGIPRALLHNLMHNKVLHEKVIFLTVLTRNIPHVPSRKRLQLISMGENFYRLIVWYGFKDRFNILTALKSCERFGLPFNIMTTSFFLGRATLIATTKLKMALWREKLFISMTRNSSQATAFFKIPPNRVIELGTQIEL